MPTKEENEARQSPGLPQKFEDEESSSDEEDEDLVLEGVIVRNPDVSDSDDTSSEEEEEEDDVKPPPPKKIKSSGNSKQQTPEKQVVKKKKNKKKKKPKSGPEVVDVEFIFCDMNDKYFHGLKTLLTSSSPIYAAHSSGLSDTMIKNIAVGTVVSTEGDEEGTVFGFASVLNVTTYQSEACVQALKKVCLEQCPAENKKELEMVLSGKTNRPAGIYLHGRMVNMPLEIVEVLHEQLVLDMDWAVKNAEGGEAERKSLDFGAFVRLAPSYRMSGATYYKYFDDEIFAEHAEFTFEVEVPKTFGMEETPYCMVLVMTKTGHRDAMGALSQMVNGGQHNR